MKFKLVLVLTIVLFLSACNLNNSNEVLYQDKKAALSLNNNILSGYENIDSLVIDKIDNGNIKKDIYSNTSYSLEDLLNIKVINDNIFVLLRDESETRMEHYKYKNNQLSSSGAGGSGNNSDITRVSIGAHMSVNENHIIRIARVIINDDELYNMSNMVEIHFEDETITREIVKNKGMLILISYINPHFDNDLLKLENCQKFDEIMEQYRTRIDFVLLKDNEGKIIYSSKK